MKKLWRYLSYCAFASKIWRWPRQSDVLIYDAAGQEVLLEYLHPWKPAVLHMRGEQINIPVLVASFFRKGGRWDAYVDCFIERVRPRLIVTFIQNNFNFYLISKRHPDVKTLFVQNGVQSYYCDVIEILDEKQMPRDALQVNYMMTFGACSGALYSRYIEGSYVPMGSLKNNLFPRRRPKTSGTIAFISQYRNTEGFVMKGEFRTRKVYFEQPDQLVLGFLVGYAKNHDKELFIVPCSACDKDKAFETEREYYRQLLGRACRFSEWSWLGSGYDSIDSAEVVVSIDSALGYESAARGNKTAIFSIRTQLLGIPGITYGWPDEYPDEGPFWTNRPDVAAFERIVDHLFKINDTQWKAEKSDHGFDNIMCYDPGNSILQLIFEKELGPAPFLRH